jgi:ABC-type transport system involved in multi-copper enzyme maturation permease subunit
VGLWTLLVVTATVFGLRWFGPVLFYDMVRSARRRRHVVARCLYALVLLGVLLFVYVHTLPERTGLNSLWDWHGDTTLSPASMAQFANTFFYLFLGVQMLGVLVLTPAYTAGAIAAERERRTLDNLLASDLSNREIVLGMFVSRLANLALVLLTGLPILSLMEVVGGVDAELVMAGFAATGLTMVSLAALGLLMSIRQHQPRRALLWTYLWTLLYLGLSALTWLLLLPDLELSDFPSSAAWTSPITVRDAVSWINAGNVFAAVVQLWLGVDSGGNLNTLVPPLLRQYAWFHGVLALVCVGWSVLRLRVCEREQASRPEAEAGPRSGTRLPGGQPWPEPALGHGALLWKEAGDSRRTWRGWLALGLAVGWSCCHWFICCTGLGISSPGALPRPAWGTGSMPGCALLAW